MREVVSDVHYGKEKEGIWTARKEYYKKPFVMNRSQIHPLKKMCTGSKEIWKVYLNFQE